MLPLCFHPGPIEGHILLPSYLGCTGFSQSPTYHWFTPFLHQELCSYVLWSSLVLSWFWTFIIQTDFARLLKDFFLNHFISFVYVLLLLYLKKAFADVHVCERCCIKKNFIYSLNFLLTYSQCLKSLRCDVLFSSTWYNDCKVNIRNLIFLPHRYESKRAVQVEVPRKVLKTQCAHV